MINHVGAEFQPNFAVFCGFFFYHVTNDIPGFQNRLGLFFFILSLFGFSCLSSVGVFANERILFMRERYVIKHD